MTMIWMYDNSYQSAYDIDNEYQIDSPLPHMRGVMCLFSFFL